MLALLKNTLCVIALLWLSPICVLSVDADDTGVCSDEGPSSTAHAIRRKIFCNYDTKIRPVKAHQNVTPVEIDLRVMFLFFYEKWNTLNVHCWAAYVWTDEHLIWDKVEYKGIDTIQISTSDVWVPDISVFNTADTAGKKSSVGGRRCWLKSTGTIKCVIPTVHSALCNADVKRWPFDTHNCSIRVGSWTHMGNQINLTLGSKAVTFEESHGFYQNREWELLSANATRQILQINKQDFPWLNFSYVLRRHAGGHAASVLIPALVLAITILIVFWLHPNSLERLSLATLNIFCICLYLVHFNAILPSNGDSSPIILLFYRDALILALVSLVNTVIVRKMETTLNHPPEWVDGAANAVLSTILGQIFLFGSLNAKEFRGNLDRSEEDNGAEHNELRLDNTSWRVLGMLLDRTFFFIVLFSFITLLRHFLP